MASVDRDPPSVGGAAAGGGGSAAGGGNAAPAAEVTIPKLVPLDIRLLQRATRGWESLVKEDEFWFDASHIEGTVPPGLFGTFLRNGPGVNEVYGQKLKHPIDGDGMVCAISFIGGKVHLRSRFIQTWSHVGEAKERKLLYKGQMGTEPKSLLSNVVSTVSALVRGQRPPLKFRHPANTNVFFWGGKILTCYETGLPYTLDPRTLETVCKDTLGGVLDIGTFAAHFRYDAARDRLVTLSIRPGLEAPGTIGFYEFDRSWNVTNRVVHKISGLNYSHDFLLTDDYYIVQMSPFVKLTKSIAYKIAMGLTSPGATVRYYDDLPCRMVFIPRFGSCEGGPSCADSEGIIQLDTEPCHIYHFGSVERYGTKLSFNAVCLGPGFNMEFAHGVWLSNSDVAPGYLYQYDADLATKTISRRLVDRSSCEFPAIHPYRHVVPESKRHLVPRFMYLMANDRGSNLPYQDVVKADVHGEGRQVWYSSGCVGEPVFVPASGEASAVVGDEDDGWVLVQYYNVDEHKTEFVILDAKHVDKGPICRIKCDFHVPYGFHGTFTPEVFVSPPSAL